MFVTSTAKAIGCLTLALALLPGSALAQTDTASIVGTVKDGTGAVLPGVTVTATQKGTNVVNTAVTNSAGQYVFPNLRIGTYDVAAELQGFRRTVRADILLNVQDRAEVNLTLEVGQLSEEVVVKGESPLLQTESASIGYSVDERQLRDLPLLGRRYAELAFLTPGVVQAPAGITSRGEDTFFNANGNYATWNNFMLDGADNNSGSTNLQERSAQVVQPPVDALQEFKVQTRTYSAEFGKAAGAIINASIKQGTNSFRGSAFEFFRDEAFNSNLWENEVNDRPKGAFNQHIFGGTIGGPVVRGKTFFFGDFQATRTEQGVTNLSVVPTALMRQGNLIELPRALVADSPFVPAGCVDVANKVINPSCIDPVARGIQGYYPLPNVASELAKAGVPGSFGNPNYFSQGLLNSDINQFDIRVDHSLGSRDQLFGRYSYMNTQRLEPPALDDPIANGNFASDITNIGQNLVFGWSKVIGTSLVSEFRGAWNQIDSDSIHLAYGIDVNSQIGLTGVPEDPRYSGGMPFVTIGGGFTRVGGPFFRPQFQTSQVYQFAENLTWTRATHNFKFGIERRRDILDYIDLSSLNGTLGFSDARYTGAGYGDFLLGLATSQGLTLFHEANLYSDGWQFYAQDSWRVTPDLTFDYGIRYEYFTPSQARDHRLTNIDPATGQVITAKDSGSTYEQTLIHPDKNDWAPRFGVAYSLGPKIVLRGGYGIFYQQQDRYGSESQLVLNPPQLIDVSLSAPDRNTAPVMILRTGFQPISAANVDPSRIQWRVQDPNQKTPMVQQFSAGFQYQLGPTMVADVEYVGNRVRNGRKLSNLNQGIINPNGTVTFPYAQYGFGTAFLEQIQTTGKSDYNALQLRVQRRFSAGLAFTSSFTYSRAKGNFLDHLSAGGGAVGNFPLNRYDPAADYGPLPFDTPKRFVTSFIYELPAGRGRAYDPGGVMGAILSDWAVNGILTLSDGRPFSVSSTDVAGTGSGRTTRANCVGDPVPSGFDQTIEHWMDIGAFQQQASRTYGNCGYNNVRGPGFKTFNFSLFRSFPFAATQRLEFRLETFNLFNWVNYNFPAASISNPGSFGRITSSIGNPREMQLAVKYYF